MDVATVVPAALRRHDAVRSVSLVGSRAQGRVTELSDWDFLVESDDFERLRADLPRLVEPLAPLAAQWDRLSEEAACYMLLLQDGTKVDLLFDRPPVLEPPWERRADTLDGIDRHFWDWILWLGGKQLRGHDELVREMLGGLMFEHVLGPLGAARPPRSIGEAVALYREARAAAERELGVDVPREPEQAVLPRLRNAGLA